MIGYYFGTAGGERIARSANEQAAQAREERADTAAIGADSVAALGAELREARQQLAELARGSERDVDDGEEASDEKITEDSEGSRREKRPNI